MWELFGEQKDDHGLDLRVIEDQFSYGIRCLMPRFSPIVVFILSLILSSSNCRISVRGNQRVGDEAFQVESWLEISSD